MARKKVLLTFPQSLVKEPVLWQIGRNYEVVTNIRGASISDDVAILAIMLEGPADQIDAALAYMASRGVKVEHLPEEE